MSKSIKIPVICVIIIALALLCGSCGIGEPQQSKPEAAEPGSAAAEQSKAEAEAIAEAMTVDYSEEDFIHNRASIFIMLNGPHWEPIYILSQWEDMFPVPELELYIDDERYGKGSAHFKGVWMHDMLTYDEANMNYNIGINVYDSQSHAVYLSREEIIEQEIYLMGYCEGRLFGFPADGGTGPLVLMSTKDGIGRIIQPNVVNITLKRGNDNFEMK